MKKLGILGGTFNPIHLGHIHLAKYAIEKANLDKIIFFPSNNPPHKKKNYLLPFDLRCKLIEKSLEKYDNFFLSRLDVRDGEPTYTYYLLQKLQIKYPDADFYFIIGEDNVVELQTWYKYEYLLEHLRFIVFTREDIDKSEWENLSYLDKLIFYKMPPFNVSSSEIRKKIINNQSILNLIPKEIQAEITKLRNYFEKIC